MRLADRLAADPAFEVETLLALDEREEFPTAACRRLDELGLPAQYVPARYGGTLREFPDLLDAVAAVAGRDLTVAVAHAKTFLGAVSVWVAGDRDQAQRLAARVLAGAPVCWALTEPGHGADLLAGELTATRAGAGWRLDGAKTTINNATRGELACVLARTDPAGGPRGFSLFLVDKRAVTGHGCAPKLRTHGIRGADISGLSFAGTELPADALVGAVGGGVETVSRALQLTRILCTGLSLGAGARALRLAVAFATDRRRYGRRVIELPLARRTLGEAVATLWLAEAVAVTAARAAHTLPGELAVLSPVAKALVPTLVDGVLGRLGELLGVRGYLAGEFEKLERDHRIVAIFDGSTAVNRAALISQFPLLARGRGGALGDTARLDAPLGELDPGRLRLAAHGCGLVADLAPAAREFPPAARFAAVAGEVTAEVAAYRPARDLPAAAFTLAERYELVVAGAACLQLWRHDPALDDAWLTACLTRVLDLLTGAQSDYDVVDGAGLRLVAA
jgi:alkylation response protein AidB-like acyl-CoA dehydrogenase